MKATRLLVLGAAALVVAVSVGLVVLSSSRFQTWAVRRALESRPNLRLTIGSVSADMHHAVLDRVRYETTAGVFEAPRVVLEVDLFEAWRHHRLAIARLASDEWTFRMAAPPAGAPPETDVPATAQAGAMATPPSSGASAAMPAQGAGFRGVLLPVALPFDLELGRVDLSGRVLLAGNTGTVKVKVSGGGLMRGQEGAFDVLGEAALTQDALSAVTLRGTVKAALGTPRTFSRVEGNFDLSATATDLRAPVTLRASVGVSRTAAGERYVVSVHAPQRPLIGVQAEYAGGGERIHGRWTLDLADTDLTPFALGQPLPAFTAIGKGEFDTDAALADVHATGTFVGRVDKLAGWQPRLAGVGPVQLTADVDIARRGDALDVRRADVRIARDGGNGAEQPVASLRSLQPFVFNPRTAEVRAADPRTDLVGVVLAGVPLAWVRQFAPQLELAGGDIRGEFTATPRASGLTFRSKSPLTIAALNVSRGGKAVVRNLDVALNTSGDFTPLGWQAEVSGFTARTGAASVALLDAKAGQLAGANQPVKATGLLSVDLAALLAQPVAANLAQLKRGEATIDFQASFGATTEIQAQLAVKNLTPGTTAPGEPLPALTADVRADLATDGTLTVNAPIVLQRADRSSDVTLAGKITFGAKGPVFNGQVTSRNFVLDDAKALAVLAPPKAPGVKSAPGAPAEPPWAGLNGTVALQLAKLVYSGTFTMSNVTGKLRFDGGNLVFEGVQAGVGDSGAANVTGAVQYDRAAPAAFGLVADVALTDFDPVPLFLAVNPRQPPTIEGKFTITTRVTAHAAALRGLLGAAVGDFELTSRGGTFRGLPVNVGNLVENSSKLASWLATAGNAITSLAGRKDYDEITSRSQAANELAKLLSTISYDQLALVVSRDDAFNANVKEFTLISPELRITGSGHAHRIDGRSPLNDIIELELRLRARGRPAELMKYLGVLDTATDDLGYAACTIPVKVEGSLARLDTTELSNRLVALAVAKTGLTEKAVDWINRLRGKGQN